MVSKASERSRRNRVKEQPGPACMKIRSGTSLHLGLYIGAGLNNGKDDVVYSEIENIEINRWRIRSKRVLFMS